MVVEFHRWFEMHCAASFLSASAKLLFLNLLEKLLFLFYLHFLVDFLHLYIELSEDRPMVTESVILPTTVSSEFNTRFESVPGPIVENAIAPSWDSLFFC